MSERSPINTSEAPAAIGPYSQGLVWGGLLFCSGQIPLDPSTGELVDGDITAQAQRCMENLDAIARGAGTSIRQAIRTTIYLTDLADFDAVNELYGQWFSEPAPARACVQVAALPKGARIEIDAIVAPL